MPLSTIFQLYRGDRTDCTGSCTSNYHTITTTTAPDFKWFIMRIKASLVVFLIGCTLRNIDKQVERLTSSTTVLLKKVFNHDMSCAFDNIK